MAQMLEDDLYVIEKSGIDPRLLPLAADLNIIQALDDEPNDVGGLTAAELKAKFDEAGLTIQKYINESLIPQVLGADSTETDRVKKENERQTAERGRAAAENERKRAETARSAAEEARDTAEGERAAAEDERAEEENARREAEALRAENENTRTANEAARLADEIDRAEAETARSKAEMSRDSKELKRQEAEVVRGENETERKRQETLRQNAEKEREEAEAARQGAVGAQVEAAQAAARTAEAASSQACGYMEGAMRYNDGALLARDAANEAAGMAGQSAADARKAAQRIEDMTVEAETVSADTPASVEKTISEEGVVNLKLSIPQGATGGSGKSAYQAAVEGGYRGTEEDFNAILASGPWLPTAGGNMSGKISLPSGKPGLSGGLSNITFGTGQDGEDIFIETYHGGGTVDIDGKVEAKSIQLKDENVVTSSSPSSILTTKKYVDENKGLPILGGDMQGMIDMTNHAITGLPSPRAPSDAVNYQTLIDAIAGLSTVAIVKIIGHYPDYTPLQMAAAFPIIVSGNYSSDKVIYIKGTVSNIEMPIIRDIQIELPTLWKYPTTGDWSYLPGYSSLKVTNHPRDLQLMYLGGISSSPLVYGLNNSSFSWSPNYVDIEGYLKVGVNV